MTTQKTAADGVGLIDRHRQAATKERPVARMTAEETQKIIAALELLRGVAEGSHVIVPKPSLQEPMKDQVYTSITVTRP